MQWHTTVHVLINTTNRVRDRQEHTFLDLNSCLLQLHGHTNTAHSLGACAWMEGFMLGRAGLAASTDMLSYLQADAELKRLAAENDVLLRQVRDLENRMTLTTRELSSSGQSPSMVRAPATGTLLRLHCLHLATHHTRCKPYGSVSEVLYR